GVMRDERAPSLDVRDVEDEDCRRQHGGHPDESGIGGLVHGESCTNKSCAKPLTVFLISSTASESDQFILRKERPRAVSKICASFMALPFLN
ncbi:MAG: hypothetical protein WB614_12925, partial [Pseudolabrys sp.]